MSKPVKNLIASEYESRFKDLTGAVVVEIRGLDAQSTTSMRNHSVNRSVDTLTRPRSSSASGTWTNNVIGAPLIWRMAPAVALVSATRGRTSPMRTAVPEGESTLWR